MQTSATVTARHASSTRHAASARTGCGVLDAIECANASTASATRLTAHAPALQDTVGSFAGNHVLLDFMAKTAETGGGKMSVRQ